MAGRKLTARRSSTPILMQFRSEYVSRRNEQFQKSVLEGSSKITPKKKAKKQENIFGDE